MSDIEKRYDDALTAGYDDYVAGRSYAPVAGFAGAYELGWKAGESDRQQNSMIEDHNAKWDRAYAAFCNSIS